MRERARMVHEGHKAYMVYVVQRNDCTDFKIANDIDPLYGEEKERALEKGVQPLVYACEVTPKGVTITHPIGFNHKQPKTRIRSSFLISLDLIIFY